MKTKINPAFGLSVAFAALLVLSGCGKEANPANQDLLGEAAEPVVAQPSAPAKTAEPKSQASQASTANQAPPAPQPPPVAPPQTFSPTLVDVVSAFDAALAKTYHATPPSAAREAWLAKERPKLTTIRAQSCSVSTPGTASVCQIQFNGVNAQVKIMLTQQGWVLVN